MKPNNTPLTPITPVQGAAERAADGMIAVTLGSGKPLGTDENFPPPPLRRRQKSPRPQVPSDFAPVLLLGMSPAMPHS